jgi:hypothetical protein
MAQSDSLYALPKTNVPGCKLLYAQVLPNGSSTPTLGENLGKIVSSVAWTATGLLTVTMNDSYLAAGVFTQLQLATAADTQVQVKSFTVATTKLLLLDILTAGSLADIAANAGNIIHLFFFVRDSSAQ